MLRGIRVIRSLFPEFQHEGAPSKNVRKSQKERKKTDNPREGWENGTPPPHRDFKERGVVR